jgi:hypothetical protein
MATTAVFLIVLTSRSQQQLAMNVHYIIKTSSFQPATKRLVNQILSLAVIN